MGWQIRKFPQFFSHEVCNSMVVFSRIHLRVSTLLTFLFRRHTAFYPSRRFFANNIIYKKTASFISFRDKRSRFSGCVCHISCFLIPFQGHFQGPLSRIYNMSSTSCHPFLFLSLIIRIINDNVLPNFKYKWWNFDESIFNIC